MTEVRDAAWEQLNGEMITCTRCPRLVAYREEVARVKRRAYRDWGYWGRPVPGFGDRDAWLLILGLAPGAHGANRTGRMFTGDGSADTLIPALYRAGFASQPASERVDDGLRLTGAFMTAVARCAPPGNRPTREELDNCRPFLHRELDLLTSVRVVLALGQIAFQGYLQLLRERGVEVPRLTFVHGARYDFDILLPGQHPPRKVPVLFASYHPSRQNTQTGRLTPQMLDEVFHEIRQFMG